MKQLVWIAPRLNDGGYTINYSSPYLIVHAIDASGNLVTGVENIVSTNNLVYADSWFSGEFQSARLQALYTINPNSSSLVRSGITQVKNLSNVLILTN